MQTVLADRALSPTHSSSVVRTPDPAATTTKFLSKPNLLPLQTVLDRMPVVSLQL